ncbi:hypothetical protein Q8A73_018182 [Channa argus]|nr:hypothetical protein Q8A73_018182 [Channa argus]
MSFSVGIKRCYESEGEERKTTTTTTTTMKEATGKVHNDDEDEDTVNYENAVDSSVLRPQTLTLTQSSSRADLFRGVSNHSCSSPSHLHLPAPASPFSDFSPPTSSFITWYQSRPGSQFFILDAKLPVPLHSWISPFPGVQGDRELSVQDEELGPGARLIPGDEGRSGRGKVREGRSRSWEVEVHNDDEDEDTVDYENAVDSSASVRHQ